MASSTSATTSTPVKVLAVGAARGSLRDLFAKIISIDAKHGKFESVLCVGDFFGNADEGLSEDTKLLLDGQIEAPLPCYVMQGDCPLPPEVIEKFASVGSEVAKNVFLLSKSGILTTHNGLRIACLGGVYNLPVYGSSDTPLGFADPFFNSQTIEKLSSNIVPKDVSASDSNLLAAMKQAATSSPYIDILLSNAWPSSIPSFSSNPPPLFDVEALLAPPVDELIRKAKPRYHFALGAGKPPQFWEREPFLWDDEDGRVTRFVSLGSFGGDVGTGKKPRWFYAFSIAPNAQPAPRPPNATLNPFTSGNVHKRSFETTGSENYRFNNVRVPGKRARREGGDNSKPPEGYKCKICEGTDHFINECPERSHPPEGYVCRICQQPGHFVRDCPTNHEPGDTGGRKPPPGYVCRACGSELHLIIDCPTDAHSRNQRGGRRSNKTQREIGPDECWFCLSNPNLAKHLIVSIGSECYLTLPKGQIIPTNDDGAKDLSPVPGGGHVLIVPITHYPTLHTIPHDLTEPVMDEVNKYKSSLQSMYAKYGASAVAFEVSMVGKKGVHAHVQVVPVPNKFKDRVESTFVQEGKLTGIRFEEDAEAALAACADGKGSYFRVDLPGGRKLVHVITQSVPFSIQFGRHVLCSLLGMGDRYDWKACAQPDNEEQADAQTFKAAFLPFDATQG